MLTQLHFVSIGFGNAVCANKVYMLRNPFTKDAARMLRSAKKDSRYIDATGRRPIKTLIVMDDGQIVGCAFSPQTVLNRILAACTDMDDEPETDEDEEDEE